MKNWLTFIVVLLAFALPVLAQPEPTEEDPQEMLFLKKGNIPPAVLRAADSLFKGDTQVGYGVFPYELKKYGWVVDKDYNGPIDHYEVSVRTKNGGEAYAVFESTGQVVTYRAIEKNRPLPRPIQEALAKSPYKDWTVSKDTEFVKNYQKKTVEHFVVRLQKDGKKKKLYFTMKGEQLVNK